MARWPATVAVSLLGLGGCALVAPLPAPTSLEARLAVFPTEDLPLEGPASIAWNAHQVPFVEADSDGDAAFLLGMVHAHLRLGQMELARHLSQGRLAEIVGPIPFFIDLDHSLRVLGYGRAARDTLARMPPETRTWLDRFTAGINHYLMSVETLPHDFTVLGLDRTPWTAEDVLTIGRLGGSDITWAKWARLLSERKRRNFVQLLREELDYGRLAPSSAAATRVDASTHPGRDHALMLVAEMLEGWARGSNSLAIGASRTASGAPMIASDPHLGVHQPNLWLIAGVRSPSLEVVGLMPVAVPLFALGRTPHIAWGGTNMRAVSSDLVDLSGLPPEAFRTEAHDIAVRFWFDTTRTNRLSPYGPVISDAPLLPFEDDETVALRWIGHRPTDEITALLRAARARSVDEFRDAFATFGVSSQNMICVDRDGGLGLVTAATLPRRDAATATASLIHDPETVDRWWADLATSEDLPFVRNPPQDFLASANNPPADSPVPLGWFFSAPDRIDRLASLVHAAERPWTVADLARLQTDTYGLGPVELREHLRIRIGQQVANNPVWRLIEAWNGRFDIDSRGALAFQAFYTAFAPALWSSHDRPDDWGGGDGTWRVLAMARSTPDAVLLEAARQGLAAAEGPLERYRVWGDIHKMPVATLFAQAPLIGNRYRFDSFPVGGSQETVMKSAHPDTVEPHRVSYGAQARHISDMADPDANHFVLLGGQDGWFNSSTQLDQIDLWRRGELVRVPLTPEAVAREAVLVHRLQPAPRN